MDIPEKEIESTLEKFHLLLGMENEKLNNSIQLALDEFNFAWMWQKVILESFPSGDTSPVPGYMYLNGQVAKFYWLCILSLMRGQLVQFGHMFRQFTECVRYSAFAITWPDDPRLDAFGTEKDDKVKMFEELALKYPDEITEIHKITKIFQSFTHPSISHTTYNRTYDENTKLYGITFTDDISEDNLKEFLIQLGIYGAKYISTVLKSPNSTTIKYDDFTKRLIPVLQVQTNNYIDQSRKVK